MLMLLVDASLLQTNRLVEEMKSRMADQIFGFWGTKSRLGGHVFVSNKHVDRKLLRCAVNFGQKSKKCSTVSEGCPQEHDGDIENLKRN